jgi:hypothetical protein
MLESKFTNTEYPTVGDVLDFLGPALCEALHNVVARAWERYTERDPLVPVPSARYRANALYELMAEEARTQLAEHDRVKVFEPEHENRRLLVGVYDDDEDLRFVFYLKKLTNKHEPRNFPTPTAVAFNAQQSLPGVPLGTRLILGYKLIELNTDIEVKIVCFDGRRAAWHHDLGTNASVEQLQLPTQPAATERVRVKAGLKRPAKKRGNERD